MGPLRPDAAQVRGTVGLVEPPILPCPECRADGVEGTARIGSRRNTCPICNSFAQAVYKRARAALADRYPDEYAQLRIEAEVSLYPGVVETFLRNHPEVA